MHIYKVSLIPTGYSFNDKLYNKLKIGLFLVEIKYISNKYPNIYLLTSLVQQDG